MLNIHQCHSAHFHASLTVKKTSFEHIAPTLATITPNLLSSVATHLEKEGKISDLSNMQKKVFKLLEHVNATNKHLPGSKLEKLKMRNDIRAYMGFFGLPAIYLTLNPNATHSLIFKLCGVMMLLT